MILNTDIIKSRLLAVLTTASVKVYRVGERDLKIDYGKIWPAVYILRQQSDANPTGSSHVLVQRFRVNLEIGIVAQKYEDGSTQGEERRKALFDDVFASLSGWMPPDGSTAFSLTGYTDGDPADTVNYGVMKWVADIFYRGVQR